MSEFTEFTAEDDAQYQAGGGDADFPDDEDKDDAIADALKAEEDAEAEGDEDDEAMAERILGGAETDIDEGEGEESGLEEDFDGEDAAAINKEFMAEPRGPSFFARVPGLPLRSSILPPRRTLEPPTPYLPKPMEGLPPVPVRQVPVGLPPVPVGLPPVPSVLPPPPTNLPLIPLKPDIPFEGLQPPQLPGVGLPNLPPLGIIAPLPLIGSLPPVMADVIPTVKSYKELLAKGEGESDTMFAFRSWIAESLDTIPFFLVDEVAVLAPQTVIYVARLLFNRYWYSVKYDVDTEKVLNYSVEISPELTQAFA